ncbi:mannosyltransferase putative-domain-containing protein [Mortierella sp. GBAus27b]|nr:mannosyltransferase putative-domain-containing protein [Mortierella sp. GBAus27b]
MADLLKDDYNRHEQLTNPSDIDFTKIGRAARIYKSLWNHIYPIYQTLIPDGQDRDRELALRELAKKHVEIDFFLRLEHRLYPWVHHHRRTAFSLYETYAGQGYVLCAGNRQFEFVVASIQAIRSKLKSKLPIQVFYINHWDLSEERRTFLREMTHDIEVLDISTILDNGLMKLGGWSIKAFSILASRFEEVMLIDSDVFFLRSPDELFSDPGYLATGALYFYDRTLGGAGRAGPDWIRAVVPFMSTFPRSTRTFRGKSDHEQESGVVLINKRKRFSGLLSVCKLNSKYERDLWTYKKFYGDKETFWSGFEIVQEPYAFVRNYGGAIGELREDNEHSVCGAQLHLDYLGRPIWWNGGVMRNKNEGVKQDLNFGYWMSGGGNQPHRERIVRDEDSVRDLLFDIGLSSMDEVKQDDLQDPVWDFRPSCLAGWTVNSLDENQVSLATSYVRLDKVAKEVEKKIQAKTPANPSEYDWDNV